MTKSDGSGEISRRALLQAATALAVVPVLACKDSDEDPIDRRASDGGTESKADCVSTTNESARSNGTTMPEEPTTSGGSTRKLFWTTEISTRVMGTPMLKEAVVASRTEATGGAIATCSPLAAAWRARALMHGSDPASSDTTLSMAA